MSWRRARMSWFADCNLIFSYNLFILSILIMRPNPPRPQFPPMLFSRSISCLFILLVCCSCSSFSVMSSVRLLIILCRVSASFPRSPLRCFSSISKFDTLNIRLLIILSFSFSLASHPQVYDEGMTGSLFECSPAFITFSWSND